MAAAHVMQLLDELDARLAHAQREITRLKEENQRLKQALAGQQTGETPRTGEAQRVGDAMPPLPQAGSPDQTMTPEPEEEASAPPAPAPHVLLNQWYERYPAAFFKGHTKPLKVGIHQDLAEREPWSNKRIRQALAHYVNLPRYAKAMREGATRIDLDGHPAGVVDPQAARFAAEKRARHAPAHNAGNAEKTARTGKQTPAPRDPKPHPRQNGQKAKQAIPGERHREDARPAEDAKTLTLEEKLASLQARFRGA